MRKILSILTILIISSNMLIAQMPMGGGARGGAGRGGANATIGHFYGKLLMLNLIKALQVQQLF